jgi:hypothetical protein
MVKIQDNLKDYLDRFECDVTIFAADDTFWIRFENGESISTMKLKDFRKEESGLMSLYGFKY